MVRIQFIKKKTILMGNTDTALVADEYHSPSGTVSSVSAEARRQQVIPYSGILRNFYVELTAAPSGNASRTLTVRVNGSNTSLAVTISGDETTGNNTTDSVRVNAGDLVSILSEETGSPATAGAMWGLELDG